MILVPPVLLPTWKERGTSQLVQGPVRYEYPYQYVTGYASMTVAGNTRAMETHLQPKRAITKPLRNYGCLQKYSRLLICYSRTPRCGGESLHEGPCLSGQDIVVEEGEARDQFGEAIVQLSSAEGDVAVVTEQLQKGQHCQAAVLEFRKLTLFQFLGVEVGVGIGEKEVSVVVNGTNQEKHLGPSQGRNGIDGLDSVGDGVGADFSGDEVVVSTGEFGDHVTELCGESKRA